MGMQLTKITCNNPICRATSLNRSDIELLLLNIPRHKQGIPLTLIDCIRDYLKSEKIADYKCEKCGSFGITKHKTFEKLPKVTLICLSRFKIGFQSQRKDTTVVKFPKVIHWDELSCGVSGKSKLEAMICHASSSIHSGHYIANVCVNNTWFEYNDEHVRRIEGAFPNAYRSWYLSAR
jgi:ubiquitin C-terminal hydrolase